MVHLKDSTTERLLQQLHKEIKGIKSVRRILDVKEDNGDFTNYRELKALLQYNLDQRDEIEAELSLRYRETGSNRSK